MNPTSPAPWPVPVDERRYEIAPTLPASVSLAIVDRVDAIDTVDAIDPGATRDGARAIAGVPTGVEVLAVRPPAPDATEHWRHELAEWFPLLASPGPFELFHVGFVPGHATPLPWVFRCTVCGSEVRHDGVMPATRSCPTCLSNTRSRAIVAALARLVHGRVAPIPDLPPRPDVRVLGISDWPRYARELAGAFDYVNTSIDAEPRLDLTEPPPHDLRERFDVVIAGDVLEHVAPPLDRAIEHLHQLIRPGGHAIVTVPYRDAAAHLERYPDLHRYRIEPGADGDDVLVNTRIDGTEERFTDLVYHGPGRSLAMREFTLSSFVGSMTTAGFDTIEVTPYRIAHAGVAVRPGRPVPFVARKPG